MLLSVISLKKYWCFSLQIKIGVDLESSKTSLACRLYIFRRADLNLATSASPSSVRSI